MQRVTRTTAATALPAPPASPGPPGFFTGGDPVANVPATVPGYEWCNGVQEELVALVLRAGLVLDAADLAQVRRSLDRLYGGGLRTVAANITLSPDDAGVVLVDAATASRTITLPPANAAGGRPLRFTFIRVDAAAANAVTIGRAGGDTIEGLTAITVPLGGRLVLSGDGASSWLRAGGAAPLGRMQAFVSSGSFSVPAGVRRVRVVCTGGGGGGAGCGVGNSGGGGGAGGTAIGWFDVTPGVAITVTIGAGGSAGVSGGGSGGVGGTSSFGALCSATGGAGGTVDGTGQGGGSGSGGAANFSGGDGAHGGGSGSALIGGHGGASFWGGGGRGGVGSAGGGVGGSVRGTGGGGSYGSAGPGGAGAPGVVVVEW